VLASNVPEVAAYGEFAIVATDTSIYDVRQARQLAEGLLSERGGLRRRLLITTFRPGLEPGQVVWVDVPERNVLNQPCLLLTSRLVYAGRKADGGDHWRFDLELIEGDYGETWQKFFRTLTTVASGVAVSAGGGVGPPPSPGGGGSGGGGSGGAGLTFAGGSRSLAVSGATAWTPICEFVDVLLPAAAAGATTLTVRCHAWLARAAGTIQVRVLALEATNVVVGTSTPGSALAWSDAAAFKEFPVTLRPTPQYYRVEAQLTDGTNEGFVAGVVLYPGGV
jgi:hypothetical protein